LAIGRKGGFSYTDITSGVDLSESEVKPEFQKFLVSAAKFQPVKDPVVPRKAASWVISGKELDGELKRWGLKNPGGVFSKVSVLGVDLDGSSKFPDTANSPRRIRSGVDDEGWNEIPEEAEEDHGHYRIYKGGLVIARLGNGRWEWTGPGFPISGQSYSSAGEAWEAGASMREEGRLENSTLHGHEGPPLPYGGEDNFPVNSSRQRSLVGFKEPLASGKGRIRSDFQDDFEDVYGYDEDDEDSGEPQEGDIVVNESRGISEVGGRWFKDFEDWDQASRVIKEKMDMDGFYPNIWLEDDHGGHTLTSIDSARQVMRE
jgi:hypothetical protein